MKVDSRWCNSEWASRMLIFLWIGKFRKRQAFLKRTSSLLMRGKNLIYLPSAAIQRIPEMIPILHIHLSPPKAKYFITNHQRVEFQSRRLVRAGWWVKPGFKLKAINQKTESEPAQASMTSAHFYTRVTPLLKNIKISNRIIKLQRFFWGRSLWMSRT